MVVTRSGGSELGSGGGQSQDPIAAQLDAIAAKLEVLVTLKEDVAALAQMLGYEQTEEKTRNQPIQFHSESYNPSPTAGTFTNQEEEGNLNVIVVTGAKVEPTGGYRPVENRDAEKTSERHGPRLENRGGRRGGYNNGDVPEGERPRRVFERRSGTDRRNEFKCEGADRGNWGITAGAWISFIDFDLRTSRLSARDVLIRFQIDEEQSSSKREGTEAEVGFVM